MMTIGFPSREKYMLVRSIRLRAAGGGGAGNSLWRPRASHAAAAPQLSNPCPTTSSCRTSCRKLLAPSTPVKRCPTASCCDSLCHTSMGFSRNMPSARTLPLHTYSTWRTFGHLMAGSKPIMVDGSPSSGSSKFVGQGRQEDVGHPWAINQCPPFKASPE